MAKRKAALKKEVISENNLVVVGIGASTDRLEDIQDFL